MEIGLFFGSFNPIHIGHLIIASYAVNNSELHQIWFIVSPQNPLKPSHTLLNEYHRLHLARLATEDDPQIKVSDAEFKLPRPSYTIDTLTYLQEKYRQHTFSIVLGSDSMQNLPHWKNYEQLLHNYSFIVYKRPGFEIPTLNAKGALSVIVLQAPFLDISATEIRRLIREGKSIRYVVPDKVREEIERSGYFK